MNKYGLLLTILIASFMMAASAHAASTTIHDIRFGEHPDKLRIVLDISEKSQFRAFALGTPYRLVVDLPEFDIPREFISGGKQSLIKQYRFGQLKPGISRLVFETTGPFVLSDAFFLPPLNGGHDRFVLDIKKASLGDFDKHKSKIVGNPQFGEGGAVSASTTDVATLTQASLQKPPSKPYTKHSSRDKKRTIIVDAGHGGNDPGAISPNKIYEKNITLSIAKILKKHLEATGRYTVHLTRDRDYYIKLRERVNIARRKEADLFISIHADSIGRSNVRGASIYTLSETASDKETAKLAERENRSDIIAGVALDHEVDEVADILLDLAVRETMNQSKMFANLMVEDMARGGVRLLPNTHRHAGFAVLKAPDIPSILIETGYLSNINDANLLNTADYQNKVAAAITNGVNTYFNKVADLEAE